MAVAYRQQPVKPVTTTTTAAAAAAAAFMSTAAAVAESLRIFLNNRRKYAISTAFR